MQTYIEDQRVKVSKIASNTRTNLLFKASCRTNGVEIELKIRINPDITKFRQRDDWDPFVMEPVSSLVNLPKEETTRCEKLFKYAINIEAIFTPQQ